MPWLLTTIYSLDVAATLLGLIAAALPTSSPRSPFSFAASFFCFICCVLPHADTSAWLVVSKSALALCVAALTGLDTHFLRFLFVLDVLAIAVLTMMHWVGASRARAAVERATMQFAIDQPAVLPSVLWLFFRSVLLLDHVFGVDKVAHVCYATPREMEEAGSESVHLHLDIYRPKWVRGALTRGARAQQEPSGDGSLATSGSGSPLLESEGIRLLDYHQLRHSRDLHRWEGIPASGAPFDFPHASTSSPVASSAASPPPASRAAASGSRESPRQTDGANGASPPPPGPAASHLADALSPPAPQPMSGGLPVLVFVHGGAWTAGLGSKAIPMKLWYFMAKRNWIVVSIDYRLAPRSRWPAYIVDCKRALRWVRRNIGQYGGDPDFICVSGGSAGGHLAALLALTTGEPRFQPGFEQERIPLRACVAWYPVTDVTQEPVRGAWERRFFGMPYEQYRAEFEAASPLLLPARDAPPMLVMHGDADTIVPVASTRTFVQRLLGESRQPTCYIEFPGAPHGFDVPPCSIRGMYSVIAAHHFLSFVHRRAMRAREQGCHVCLYIPPPSPSLPKAVQESGPARPEEEEEAGFQKA